MYTLVGNNLVHMGYRRLLHGITIQYLWQQLSSSWPNFKVEKVFISRRGFATLRSVKKQPFDARISESLARTTQNPGTYELGSVGERSPQ